MWQPTKSSPGNTMLHLMLATFHHMVQITFEVFAAIQVMLISAFSRDFLTNECSRIYKKALIALTLRYAAFKRHFHATLESNLNWKYNSHYLNTTFGPHVGTDASTFFVIVASDGPLDFKNKTFSVWLLWQ